MIVATAGHVDHGKTTLIKALTGVDADRLPEEKKRGMTIDLGFAYLPRPQGEAIGFIDVPGHEGFVHNMLCGLAGIDAVLFVIAADDGIMPQTREHLTILDLLEVRRGMVALTKVDRVDAARAAGVKRDIDQLTAGTSLADIPVFPVSAATGLGVGALAAHLHAMADKLPRRTVTGNFRMAVDRSFTLAGAGLIVTGTAVAGSLRSGDAVRALLAEAPARVRGVHMQNAPAADAVAGSRCALNLAGDIKGIQIRRGDWVVVPDAAPAVRKFDARIRVPAGEQPLRHWTAVHAHLGASDVTGRVALLEGEFIAPGEAGFVQLLLNEAIGAVFGDRLVLRDQSARRTLAGGVVIDIFPPPRGRAKPERLSALRAHALPDIGAALSSLLEAAPAGLPLRQFAGNRNLAPADAEALFAHVPMRRVGSGPDTLAYAPARWTALRESAEAALAAWHRSHPDTPGLAQSRLLAGTGIRLPNTALAALVEDMLGEGRMVRTGTVLCLPGHAVKFSPADAVLWEKIESRLRADAERPPVAGEIAAQLELPLPRVQSLLERAARRGLVFRITPNRFFLPNTVFQLADLTREIAEQSAERRVTPLALRERCALGRNLAVDVLEFFDRVGYTRRIGDSRLVVRPAGEVFGGA
jgi:selenocysteine-specific elongation factor